MLVRRVFDPLANDDALQHVDETYSELVKDLADMKMSTYIALLEALRDVDNRVDFSALMVKNWLVDTLPHYMLPVRRLSKEETQNTKESDSSDNAHKS